MFKWYVDHRDLHSFPTRRSSDLYQTPLTTLRQMFEVSGAGLVLAAIYLYTHSLLLIMTYHGLYDFILFLQAGIGEYGNPVKSAVQPTMMDWQGTILRVTIYAAIADRKSVV